MNDRDREIAIVRARTALLIAQARIERKMIVYQPHDAWLTPDELEAEQAQGQYCFGGPSLFELRNPLEWLEAYQKRVIDVHHELERRRKIVTKYFGLTIKKEVRE